MPADRFAPVARSGLTAMHTGDTSSSVDRYRSRRKRDIDKGGAGLMPKRATNDGKSSREVVAATQAFLDRLNGDPVALDPDHRAKTIRVRKNRDIIVAGNHYGCIYVNHDGWLFRYKILHDGSRQIVDFILPGQIFGLQSCLFKRSLYSVATINEASLSVIPFAMIDDVFERNPALSKALFWSAVCETAILGERLTDAARRSAYERVSHFLLELLVRLNGVGLTTGMTFCMPLTQELIGDALGLTTVHVNRTFRLLRDDKLIAIDGKSITILDFEALSLLSDFENSYLGESARALHDKLGSGAADGQPPRKRSVAPV
jgi:CRP-like cAMP-binding protein